MNFIFITLWGAAEYLRLRYAFIGNIKESFPELTAFLIISIVFSLPLLAYQYIVVTLRFPIDDAVGIIAGLFLVVEIVLAIRATSRLVKN